MISNNYANRTIDLLIFQGVNPEKDVQVGLTLDDYICTGVQKAAQTFAILFLTEKGTVLEDPDKGTEFLSKVRTGYVRDPLSLSSEFKFAVLEILQYESAVDRTAPDDEKIVNAELLDYDMSFDTLKITVKVTTAAGDSRTIFIPVNTVIK